MMKNKKIQNICMWIFTVLLSLAAGVTGIMKLIPVERILKSMNEMGYSIPFVRILGVFWLLGAVGIYFKPLRNHAALGMLLILSGAIASHWVVGDDGSVFAPILGIAVLALFLLFFNGFFCVDFRSQKKS